MIEWFASHSFLEQVFLICGTVGGIILLFRMVLMIIGLDHPLDVHDGDAGGEALTLQGISSFLAMLGAVGYTLFHGGVLAGALAIVAAVASGACRSTLQTACVNSRRSRRMARPSPPGCRFGCQTSRRTRWSSHPSSAEFRFPMGF